MAHWHRLGVAVGLTALVGCGSPLPDGPRSSPSTGSADAVVAIPAGAAPPPASPPARLRRRPSRSTHPQPQQRGAAPTRHAPPVPRLPPPQRAPAIRRADHSRAGAARGTGELVRRAARVAGRHGPAPGAGDLGAAAGHGIDPLTYALVDEDEAVRARAEALYEQQLAQEEATATLRR